VENLSSYKYIYNAVGCGHPSPPANGTIEPYSSTQVGAEVQYHCDEGHTPREWRTSQCQENGSWAPDPALDNCALGKLEQGILKNKFPVVYISVDCGLPNTTINVSLTVNTTTYNSTATYMCGSGLVSSEVYITECTRQGEWEPDPSTLECREPGIFHLLYTLCQFSLSYVILLADCGVPEALSSSFVTQISKKTRH